MTHSEIIQIVEKYASPTLQESYDNSGLQVGNTTEKCTGVLIALDATPALIAEAVQRQCNLILVHHPLLFKGLKRITGKTDVEKTVFEAIKNGIAIYAIHTNLDNVLEGVSGQMAKKLNLKDVKVLLPRKNILQKLSLYIPESHYDTVISALFAAGAGNIGNYTECSFNTTGTGTFKPGDNANPYTGEIGTRQYEQEIKTEVVFEEWKANAILKAMKEAHPYEEVAYYIQSTENEYDRIGSGVIGSLPKAMSLPAFLKKLQTTFKIPAIRYSEGRGGKISTVALCGGAGSFLTSRAIQSGADILVTADFKYHDFFESNSNIVLADIGHFESEQYTIDLLIELLKKNFSNFAILKSKTITNPVKYFVG